MRVWYNDSHTLCSQGVVWSSQQLCPPFVTASQKTKLPVYIKIIRVSLTQKQKENNKTTENVSISTPVFSYLWKTSEDCHPKKELKLTAALPGLTLEQNFWISSLHLFSSSGSSLMFSPCNTHTHTITLWLELSTGSDFHTDWYLALAKSTSHIAGIHWINFEQTTRQLIIWKCFSPSLSLSRPHTHTHMHAYTSPSSPPPPGLKKGL